MVDFSLLEHTLRQDLKAKVPAVMAVLNPLKVVLTNYEGPGTELLSLDNSSENADLGKREVPFSGTLYIEREDFMEHLSPGFRRLILGGEVRLKGAYIIKCHEVIKDPATGEISELRCTYDRETKSGSALSGRKVKGTIHWVSAATAIAAEVRLYEKLLTDNEGPKDEHGAWEEAINPDSVKIMEHCLVEPFVQTALPEDKFQFMRHGYFVADSKLSSTERLVFGRIVPLKDGWKDKK
jgi:glutaminyl-tRNA synthetase